jgi:hypothetical protein
MGIFVAVCQARALPLDAGAHSCTIPVKQYLSVSSGPKLGEKGVRAWMSGCLLNFPAVMG